MVTEADPTTNIREAASGQPTAGIEADDSIDDQGYAQSTSTSYVTSIASDIRRGVEENGRLYASYGRYKPMMPIDESEVRLPSARPRHLVNSLVFSARPQRPPTLQIHPPPRRPSPPLPYQLQTAQNPRPGHGLRYLGPRHCG